MRLTLVRHASAAEPRGRSARADAERDLTPRGKRRFKEVRRALKRAGLAFDGLLFSPRVRALKTAGLLRPLVEGPARAEALLAAAPGKALLERLEGERLVLVGHQPWLGQLAAWLVLGNRALGSALAWKPGGVAVLEGEPVPGGMRLVGFLPPRLLRRLARR